MISAALSTIFLWAAHHYYYNSASLSEATNHLLFLGKAIVAIIMYTSVLHQTKFWIEELERERSCIMRGWDIVNWGTNMWEIEKLMISFSFHFWMGRDMIAATAGRTCFWVMRDGHLVGKLWGVLEMSRPLGKLLTEIWVGLIFILILFLQIQYRSKKSSRLNTDSIFDSTWCYKNDFHLCNAALMMQTVPAKHFLWIWGNVSISMVTGMLWCWHIDYPADALDSEQRIWD